ncbi:hypothetical protein OCUAc20_15080 [Acinetobacter baumannii]|nr:hypothetical protein OCUAc20_15080 [Acinetobacter baumannii]
MSEQEKDLQADIDYFIQEQATNALLNQTSFIENLSVQSNLFEQLKSQFFNEMLDDATSNGVASKKIEQWLSIRTLDELKQLNAEAKQHFLYHGITFNVYGDKEEWRERYLLISFQGLLKKTVGKNRSWLCTAS